MVRSLINNLGKSYREEELKSLIDNQKVIISDIEGLAKQLIAYMEVRGIKYTHKTLPYKMFKITIGD